MLKENFFRVRSLESPEQRTVPDAFPQSYRIVVELLPDHPIYGGHFPGNPVVPGVCQIRMITELVAGIMKKEVYLQTADNIKFLAAINPFKTPLLSFDIFLKPGMQDSLHCNAIISSEENVFCTCKSVYQIRSSSHDLSKDIHV